MTEPRWFRIFLVILISAFVLWLALSIFLLIERQTILLMGVLVCSHFIVFLLGRIYQLTKLDRQLAQEAN